MSKKRLNICTSCNHENKKTAKFCEECGVSIKAVKKANDNKTANKNYAVIFGGVIIIAIAIVFYYNYQLLKNIGVDERNHQHEQSENAHPGSMEMPLMDMDVLADKKAKIENEPDNIDAKIELANYLFDYKQFEEAIQYYQKVLDSNKNLPDIYVEIGVCYFNLNNLTQAEKYFRDAMQINPIHSKAMFNLGVVYFNLNKKEEAVSIWQELIEKSPESMEAIRAKDFFNR